MKSRFFLPSTLVSALIVVLVLLSGEWLIMRKVGALFVMPVGLLWLAGLFLIALPGVSRGLRFSLLVGWLVYSLAGSPYVGNVLIRQLEQPFYSSEKLTVPLDALVLLGGGTASTPGGSPAMGAHGDRVLRPAVLFHEGKVDTLITTGRSITEKGKDRILSEETSKIWQSVGIPESSIIQLPDPRNTAEELAAVAELLSQNPGWDRVGLCSSASHLRRAMKQAEKQGLELIPVPSDFRSSKLPLTPLYLVPQGRGFRDVQTALWEYLGALF